MKTAEFEQPKIYTNNGASFDFKTSSIQFTSSSSESFDSGEVVIHNPIKKRKLVVKPNSSTSADTPNTSTTTEVKEYIAMVLITLVACFFYTIYILG